uniref:BHLH domain-containing protein n=2 Tax=Caenorhabditis japonica TaxID=281687 RepID=A0A8R1HL96_CAEJA
MTSSSSSSSMTSTSAHDHLQIFAQSGQNSGYFMEHHMNIQEHRNCEQMDPSTVVSVSVSAPEKRQKRKYRCRKRSPATIERAKTVRRDKANARERRRMNSLNDALEHLRTILPALPDEPKMTKIETLKKAQEYIASLAYQLSSSSPDPDHPSPVFSTNCCENASCGCCSSVQSTPFQSPSFPPPAQLQYHHHNYQNSQGSQHNYYH